MYIYIYRERERYACIWVSTLLAVGRLLEHGLRHHGGLDDLAKGTVADSYALNVLGKCVAEILGLLLV